MGLGPVEEVAGTGSDEFGCLPIGSVVPLEAEAEVGFDGLALGQQLRVEVLVVMDQKIAVTRGFFEFAWREMTARGSPMPTSYQFCGKGLRQALMWVEFAKP